MTSPACSPARASRVTALARADLDITDPAAVRGAVTRHRPDVVVNCAAWTAVDDAEAHEDAALAVNGRAVAHLAAACASASAPPWCSSPPTTSSTARRQSPYAEDAPGRAAQRLRPDQAGRRSRRPARRCPTAQLHAAHRLAVRGARQELRTAPCSRRALDGRPGQRGRRPARPAHLDRRRRPPDLRPDQRRRARRAPTTPPVPARSPGSVSPATSTRGQAPTRRW